MCARAEPLHPPVGARPSRHCLLNAELACLSSGARLESAEVVVLSASAVSVPIVLIVHLARAHYYHREVSIRETDAGPSARGVVGIYVSISPKS